MQLPTKRVYKDLKDIQYAVKDDRHLNLNIYIFFLGGGGNLSVCESQTPLSCHSGPAVCPAGPVISPLSRLAIVSPISSSLSLSLSLPPHVSHPQVPQVLSRLVLEGLWSRWKNKLGATLKLNMRPLFWLPSCFSASTLPYMAASAATGRQERTHMGNSVCTVHLFLRRIFLKSFLGSQCNRQCENTSTFYSDYACSP